MGVKIYEIGNSEIPFKSTYYRGLIAFISEKLKIFQNKLKHFSSQC